MDTVSMFLQVSPEQQANSYFILLQMFSSIKTPLGYEYINSSIFMLTHT